MKSTTIAILATLIPAQMALAGNEPKNAMDALETLNKKGYVDLGIEETNDAIVVYGEKSGKRVSQTYQKSDFDLVTERVTKVNPNNVSTDKDAPQGDIARAESDTEDARAFLAEAREEGLGPQDIKDGEIALEETEAEEDAIRDDLAAAAPKKPAAAAAEKPAVKVVKEKAPAKAVKGDIARAESDTEKARADLAHAREEGYGPMDIKEAEIALEEAEAEEDAIREDNAKASSEPKAAAEAKKPKGDLNRAENDTDEARENLANAREEGLGPQDIKEGEIALEETEAEEDAIRADNAN